MPLNVIIHHSADPDGLMSAAVIQEHLSKTSNDVQLIGWDYGDPTPIIPSDAAKIYMADVCIDELLNDPAIRSRTVLIDHHRTALEKWASRWESFADFFVYEGIGACRLCWVYFRGPVRSQLHTITRKQNLEFEEPKSLFIVGLRDVWNHRGTQWEQPAEYLDLALHAEWPPDMRKILHYSDTALEVLIDEGRIMDRYARSISREFAARSARVIDFQGLKFLCLNTQQRGHLALDAWSREIAECEPHQALMIWFQDATGRVSVSMYHAHGNEHIDLSMIAKNFGGGGHPGACGFRMSLIEWVQVVG